MAGFTTRTLPDAPDAIAPDGSEVRLLGTVQGGGLAQFRLAPGQVARAVMHRTVEEIWYVVEGTGDIWRSLAGDEAVTRLQPGVAVTIPLGAVFQFRADAAGPLTILGATMPPWPGPDEAVERNGPWRPSS